MNNLVSVVIPFYNVSDKISLTLRSIQSQTYKSLDVILVDDGSDDDSIQAIESLIKGDERFRIIHQQNAGPASARILGLKHAKGDYVFFLDSDDLIHPNAIESLLAVAVDNNVEIAIAKYETFYKFENQFKESLSLKTIEFEKKDILKELAICTRIQNFIWGKLFRKEIIDASDFDSEKLLGEDIATLYKIFNRCKKAVYLDGTPLVLYYQNPDSISHKLSYRKLNDYCNALIEKTNFYKQNYPDYYGLTFYANIDFWFLAEVNYDLRRINNIFELKKHIDSTCHGLRNKMKLFVANRPGIARKMIKKHAYETESNKKRIAIINTYNSMSTGNVAKTISDGMADEYDFKLFYGRCYDKWDNASIYFGGSKFFNFINNIYVKFSGNIGGAHKLATRRLIKKLKQYNPDIVHLHNIHGNFVNYKMLFNYLKDKNVVVTMHDCFWLTGRCAHFVNEKIICDGWKSECKKCKYKNIYMQTLLFDKANKIYNLKQSFLSNSKNLHLVALSSWQANLFRKQKVDLIPNGFDFDVQCQQKSANNKTIIIGVSQNWIPSKGINDFNYLAEKLDSQKYEIRLIGKMGKNVVANKNIKILGTLSQQEVLKQISQSDIFVNPTYVDTFPTVLIESLACGTPVITYDVGGCKDIVGDCGRFVERGDTNQLLKAVLEFNPTDFSKEKIVERSKKFNKEKMIDGYKKLFKEVLHGTN